MPENWMQVAQAAVGKALELDPNDPEAHRIMGAIRLLFEGDTDKAVFHHQKAIEMCPSDTFHIARYAILLVYLGDPEAGLKEIKKAMRIDPFGTDLIYEAEGLCYFWLKDFERAKISFKRMQVSTRDSLFYLAAVFKLLAEEEKASETLKQALNLSKMTIKKFSGSQAYKLEENKKEVEQILSSIS
jgi:Tfp pilus assembly protein PilF